MSHPSMNTTLPLDVLNHHFPAAPFASVRITRLLYYTADPLSTIASVITIVITDCLAMSHREVPVVHVHLKSCLQTICRRSKHSRTACRIIAYITSTAKYKVTSKPKYKVT